MKQNEHKEFPWTGVFLATAISFFIFSVFIKILNGNPAHMRLFFLVGCISLGLGLLALIAGLSTSTKRVYKKAG